MADIATDRKQRLRALEKQIRKDYEAFVQTGFALKEIRDDELYREDGYETWDRYLKERVGVEFGIEARQVQKLIACAQIRPKLPDLSRTAVREEGLSQNVILEFGRLAPKSEEHAQRADFDALKKKDVERVAKKVIAHCEKEEVPLTSTVVRKFVDADLGIDRAKQAKEVKEKRQEEEKKIERQQEEEATIERRIEDLIWQMKKYRENLSEMIAETPDEVWTQWKRNNQVLVKRLAAACNAFTELLES